MSLHTICLLTQKRVWCGDWADIVVLLAPQTTVTESWLGLRDLGAIRHYSTRLLSGLAQNSKKQISFCRSRDNTLHRKLAKLSSKINLDE